MGLFWDDEEYWAPEGTSKKEETFPQLVLPEVDWTAEAGPITPPPDFGGYSSIEDLIASLQTPDYTEDQSFYEEPLPPLPPQDNWQWMDFPAPEQEQQAGFLPPVFGDDGDSPSWGTMFEDATLPFSTRLQNYVSDNYATDPWSEVVDWRGGLNPLFGGGHDTSEYVRRFATDSIGDPGAFQTDIFPFGYAPPSDPYSGYGSIDELVASLQTPDYTGDQRFSPENGRSMGGSFWGPNDGAMDSGWIDPAPGMEDAVPRLFFDKDIDYGDTEIPAPGQGMMDIMLGAGRAAETRRQGRGPQYGFMDFAGDVLHGANVLSTAPKEVATDLFPLTVDTWTGELIPDLMRRGLDQVGLDNRYTDAMINASDYAQFLNPVTGAGKLAGMIAERKGVYEPGSGYDDAGRIFTTAAESDNPWDYAERLTKQNEERPWQQQLLGEVINPTNLLGMGLYEKSATAPLWLQRLDKAADIAQGGPIFSKVLGNAGIAGRLADETGSLPAKAAARLAAPALGGVAGYALPADSDEERQRNAAIGAGALGAYANADFLGSKVYGGILRNTPLLNKIQRSAGVDEIGLRPQLFEDLVRPVAKVNLEESYSLPKRVIQTLRQAANQAKDVPAFHDAGRLIDHGTTVNQLIKDDQLGKWSVRFEKAGIAADPETGAAIMKNGETIPAIVRTVKEGKPPHTTIVDNATWADIAENWKPYYENGYIDDAQLGVLREVDAELGKIREQQIAMGLIDPEPRPAWQEDSLYFPRGKPIPQSQVGQKVDIPNGRGQVPVGRLPGSSKEAKYTAGAEGITFFQKAYPQPADAVANYVKDELDEIVVQGTLRQLVNVPIGATMPAGTVLPDGTKLTEDLDLTFGHIIANTADQEELKQLQKAISPLQRTAREATAKANIYARSARIDERRGFKINKAVAELQEAAQGAADNPQRLAQAKTVILGEAKAAADDALAVIKAADQLYAEDTKQVVRNISDQNLESGRQAARDAKEAIGIYADEAEQALRKSLDPAETARRAGIREKASQLEKELKSLRGKIQRLEEETIPKLEAADESARVVHETLQGFGFNDHPDELLVTAAQITKAKMEEALALKDEFLSLMPNVRAEDSAALAGLSEAERAAKSLIDIPASQRVANAKNLAEGTKRAAALQEYGQKLSGKSSRKFVTAAEELGSLYKAFGEISALGKEAKKVGASQAVQEGLAEKWMQKAIDALEEARPLLERRADIKDGEKFAAAARAWIENKESGVGKLATPDLLAPLSNTKLPADIAGTFNRALKDPRSIPVIHQINTFLRPAMASADASFMGVTGWVQSMTAPKSAVPAMGAGLKAMGKSFVDSKAAEKIQTETFENLNKKLAAVHPDLSIETLMARSGLQVSPSEVTLEGVKGDSALKALKERRVTDAFAQLPVIKQSGLGFSVAGNEARSRLATQGILEADLAGNVVVDGKVNWDTVNRVVAHANSVGGRANRAVLQNVGDVAVMSPKTAGDVAFAGRYLQSQFDLLANAALSGKLEGDLARKTMIRFGVGGVVSVIALNNLLGNDDYDYLSPMKNGYPNPNFMRVRVLGHDLSPFGSMDAIAKLAAGTAMSLADGEIGQAGEQWVDFTRSKLSPGMGALWSMIDGETFTGEPTASIETGGPVGLKVENPKGIVEMLDPSPMSVRNIIGETKEVDWTDPKSIAEALFGISAAFTGARVNPMSDSEKMIADAISAYKDYEPDDPRWTFDLNGDPYLDPLFIKKFKSDNPDKVPEPRSETSKQYAALREFYDEKFAANDDAFVSGGSVEDWREGRKLLKEAYKLQAEKDGLEFDERELPPKGTGAYWVQTYFDALEDGDEGVTEWVKDNGKVAREYVQAYFREGKSEVEAAYLEDMATLDKLGYFDNDRYKFTKLNNEKTKAIQDEFDEIRKIADLIKAGNEPTKAAAKKVEGYEKYGGREDRQEMLADFIKREYGYKPGTPQFIDVLNYGRESAYTDWYKDFKKKYGDLGIWFDKRDGITWDVIETARN